MKNKEKTAPNDGIKTKSFLPLQPEAQIQRAMYFKEKTLSKHYLCFHQFTVPFMSS